MQPSVDSSYDAVIVGSGFGGAFAAHALVAGGWRVLLIERGGWVERGPAASRAENFVLATRHYARDTGYAVAQDGKSARAQGALFCVGGASVFFGGVSLRLRESDFAPPEAITGDSAAEWPVGYADLEPHYDRAERILGVGGVTGADPTEPPRSRPYPFPPPDPAPVSAWLAEAARGLGLHPFPLPMAIHHAADAVAGPAVCTRCGACDGFACHVGAKNDVVTRILEPLGRSGGGFRLLTGTAAVRLRAEQGRITGIECVELASGRRFVVAGREVLLGAGALATPHLLLASGLERANPAGWAVGRFLMRHINSVNFGYLDRRVVPDGFAKNIGIHDFYGGDGAPGAPGGPLGGIQSLPAPPSGVVRTQVPWPLPVLAERFLARAAGLLTIGEDQPQRDNGVRLDPGARDAAGLPGLRITHRYSPRDLGVDRALRREARRILRAAGARFCYHRPIRTFSHALGTVRMGRDERQAPLDAEGRFRGIANLRVVDASVFPTAAAVNPSLTIAANALRVSAALLSRQPVLAGEARA